MSEKVKKRVRSKDVGFVGVNLAKGGDMTLYDRLLQEVKNDPEMDQSKVIRLALKEYFDRKDNK
jgi:hypothetical protein